MKDFVIAVLGNLTGISIALFIKHLLTKERNNDN